MSTPIPILFTIPNFLTAGSGRAMLNVIERLDRRRFAPSVCVLRRGGALEAELERLDIPEFEAPFTVSARPLPTLLPRVFTAAKAFRRRGFALWHSFHYLDDYTEPLIARSSGARAWIYTKKNMSWNRRSWFLRTLLASRVGAQNTDMIRRFFASGLFRARASHVPPGVDMELFRPDTLPRLGIRKSLGLPRTTTLVGCVAHLVPVKGHPTLLDAVARVPDVHLVCAGKPLDERYAAELSKTSADSRLAGRVSFVGEVADVSALLSELDIFVLPTWDAFRMEGCPVALLEAMASGRACVATDIPGPRDVVATGRNGILVKPRDVEALAGALRDLAGDPERRRALGRAARERILERFTADREAAAYQAMYEELVARGWRWDGKGRAA